MTLRMMGLSLMAAVLAAALICGDGCGPQPDLAAGAAPATANTGCYNPGSAVYRDARGRILRSAAVRRQFLRQTGYPQGRPGYVVDHIIALKRGGADSTANMQWQTVAAGEVKDREE